MSRHLGIWPGVSVEARVGVLKLERPSFDSRPPCGSYRRKVLPAILVVHLDQGGLVVYWRLAEWLAERKEPWTRYRLVQESGLSPTVIYRLARRGEPVRRIDGRTLDTLCAMLDAQPGDLLRYVPTPRTRRKARKQGS